MYESRKQPILPFHRFFRRITGHLILVLLVCAMALGIGVIGYHFLAELSWIDSLLNASMILGGMGPVDPLHTNAAKIFASFYALFSGIVLIGAASLMIAPFVHRLLHQFHMD